MIKELNPQRLNFVLPIGRRFYCACAALLRHFIHCGVEGNDNSSINGIREDYNNEEFMSDIRFSFNSPAESFNPLSYENMSGDDSNTAAFQLFSCFGSEMFMNVYTHVNKYQFKKAYEDIYSEEAGSVIYAVSECIVPIEVNICHFKIKCSYGPDRYIWKRRYPLIDVLYRSDEMIGFINHLVSGMMLSTHLYFEFYECIACEIDRHRDSLRDGYSHYDRTWDSNFLNFRKHFELMA